MLTSMELSMIYGVAKPPYPVTSMPIASGEYLDSMLSFSASLNRFERSEFVRLARTAAARWQSPPTFAALCIATGKVDEAVKYIADMPDWKAIRACLRSGIFDLMDWALGRYGPDAVAETMVRNKHDYNFVKRVVLPESELFREAFEPHFGDGGAVLNLQHSSPALNLLLDAANRTPHVALTKYGIDHRLWLEHGGTLRSVTDKTLNSVSTPALLSMVGSGSLSSDQVGIAMGSLLGRDDVHYADLIAAGMYGYASEQFSRRAREVSLNYDNGAAAGLAAAPLNFVLRLPDRVEANDEGAPAAVMAFAVATNLANHSGGEVFFEEGDDSALYRIDEECYYPTVDLSGVNGWRASSVPAGDMVIFNCHGAPAFSTDVVNRLHTEGRVIAVDAGADSGAVMLALGGSGVHYTWVYSSRMLETAIIDFINGWPEEV